MTGSCGLDPDINRCEFFMKDKLGCRPLFTLQGSDSHLYLLSYQRFCIGLLYESLNLIVSPAAIHQTE